MIICKVGKKLETGLITFGQFFQNLPIRTYTNCIKRSAVVGKKKTSVKEDVRVVTLIYLACTLANAAKSASNDNFASHSNYYGTNHYGIIRCRHVEF